MQSIFALLSILVATAFPLRAATVTLAWDPNSEPDIAGYTVYYSEAGAKSQEVLKTSEAYAHIPYLLEGRTYEFTVRAFSVSGLESAPSESITYTVPAATRLNFRWEPSSAPDLSHYTICWRGPSEPDFTTMRSTGTSYLFTSLLPGVRYEFIVRAYNSAGLECDIYHGGAVIIPSPGNWIAIIRIVNARARYTGYDLGPQDIQSASRGTKAFVIAGDASFSASLLSNADQGSNPSWVWNYALHSSPTQDSGTAPDAINGAWRGADTIQVLIPADGKGTQRLSVYSIDSERLGILQNVEILDGKTGEVLRSIKIGSFYKGIYLNFEISGAVIVRVRRVSGPYAVASGLFLDRAVSL